MTLSREAGAAERSRTPHDPSRQILPFRESLLAMLGLALVLALVALDQTVVGTALPTIVTELKGYDLYAWVATSYMLANVVMIPVFGRLGDFYGRKPFVLGGIVVFTSASGCCALAPNMPFLVAMRGLQGIGGGMLVGTTFATVADLFPDTRLRLRWQVIISSTFGIANAFGPSFGGFLTQYTGWRSVFLVNLPIGVVSLLFAWRNLPRLRGSAHGNSIRLDWIGAVLVILTFGSLQLFVQRVPKLGLDVLDGALLAMTCGAGFLLWVWERRHSHPLIPFDLLRDPQLGPLFQMSLLAGFILFALLIYTPLLFQGGFGLNPKDAGLLITPLMVCITLGSIINGRIAPRLRSPRRIMILGFLLLSLGAGGIAVCSASTGHLQLFLLMAMAGFGFGFVVPCVTVFMQHLVARESVGIATALMQSLRSLGGLIGTAVTGALISHAYRTRLPGMLVAHGRTDGSDAVASGEILLHPVAATVPIDAQLLGLARDAFVGACHVGFWLAAALAVVGLWQVRRVPAVDFRSRAVPVAVDAPG